MCAPNQLPTWRAALAAGVLSIAFALPGCEVADVHREACEVMTKIAKDGQKKRHFRDWIAARLGDARFRETLRHGANLRSGDERFAEYGSPDWKYLGLDERYVEVDFDMDFIKDAEPHWDNSVVHSVWLYQGLRTSLVFKLDSPRGLSQIADGLKTTLYQREDGVFLVCMHPSS